MKVINSKGGVKARSVNDRAIEHSISQKTELSKKNERELTGKAERAVHQADRNTQKAETRNGAVPNRPIPAQQKKNGVALGKPQYGETTSTAESKSVFEQRHIGAQRENVLPSGSKTASTAKAETLSPKTQDKPQTGIKTADTAAEKTTPTPFRPPKQYKLSPNQPKNRKYKVLKNGTVDNGGLTKKKERVIYSKQQEQKLKNAKPKKIDKPVSSPAERLSISVPKPKADRKSHIISRIKLKKFRLKKVKRQRIRLNREQTATLRNMFSAKKTLGGAAKAAEVIKKPIDKVKGTVLSQRPKTDKTEDSGTEAVKLGAQSADYLERGLKTAKNVGTKTAEKSTKLAKRVYRKFHKPTRAEIKRHLRKQVDRQFSGQLRHLTKRAVNKGAKAAAKTTAKAAKTAAKTAKQAAQAAQKAVQATARAVASAVAKIGSFIASTMPYSLIIIGAILLIVILCLCMTEIIGGAGGSVAGGGAWLVDDSSNQTPEEIYEGYKKFIEQAKDVMETQAKDALQNEVTSFCSGDTSDPRKIIQYIDKNHNSTFFPANGADSTINAWIDEFGTDDKTVESNSVANQRKLIDDFIAKHDDIEVVAEKVDDGYSGVLYDRPAFTEMMELIKQGKANCVIVKDLSRLGREYIETGRYLRRVFPAYGVRFIAINDNFDTLNEKADELSVSIKNIMNEEYSRDISVKTRSALDIKRRNGDFVGAFTVYGYLKTGESHKSLVIDPFAANVVRDIFRKRLEGYSANSIAAELNERGILSPLAYKRLQGLPYAKGGYADREDCKWSATTVIRILQDEIYTGTMVQGKQKTPHFKLKELETKPPEEWVRVEGTHEAIIDKADFDLVQKLRRLDTRTAPHLEKVHLFSGVLVCGCCGSRMTRKTNHYKGKEYHYYYCPSGKKGGCQSSSMIKESDLIECVQTSLKNHIDSIVTLNSFITSVSQERINRELVQEYTQYIQANERQLEQVESFKRKLYR